MLFLAKARATGWIIGIYQANKISEVRDYLKECNFSLNEIDVEAAPIVDLVEREQIVGKTYHNPGTRFKDFWKMIKGAFK